MRFLNESASDLTLLWVDYSGKLAHDVPNDADHRRSPEPEQPGGPVPPRDMTYRRASNFRACAVPSLMLNCRWRRLYDLRVWTTDIGGDGDDRTVRRRTGRLPV